MHLLSSVAVSEESFRPFSKCVISVIITHLEEGQMPMITALSVPKKRTDFEKWQGNAN